MDQARILTGVNVQLDTVEIFAKLVGSASGLPLHFQLFELVRLKTVAGALLIEHTLYLQFNNVSTRSCFVSLATTCTTATTGISAFHLCRHCLFVAFCRIRRAVQYFTHISFPFFLAFL